MTLRLHIPYRNLGLEELLAKLKRIAGHLLAVEGLLHFVDNVLAQKIKVIVLD